MPLTAPGISTFDLDDPRRPGPDDVDATLEDDAKHKPKPTMPYAAQLNTWAELARAYGAVVPVAMIEGWVASGTPFVKYLQTLRSTLVIGDLTVARTSGEPAGSVEITWAASTFPTPSSSPDARMAETGSWLAPIAETITNGVRVETRADGGALTDGKVKIYVY